MKKREFLKKAAVITTGVIFLPSCGTKLPSNNGRLRTAHIGLGVQGIEDLRDISSHNSVDVVALCDVDSKNLAAAKLLHPNAKTYTDYRKMLK